MPRRYAIPGTRRRRICEIEAPPSAATQGKERGYAMRLEAEERGVRVRAS